MQERCPDYRFICIGVLKGHRWLISERGFANVVRSPFDMVYGVVYEISGSDERKLDQHEGVSSGSYRKELLCVEINGMPTVYNSRHHLTDSESPLGYAARIFSFAIATLSLNVCIGVLP
jgi:gamma-glutamylcyclotransferase